MATDSHSNDVLRNPAVDYERADLSPKGILLFLVGLLLCGIFIELVIWGMFRFLRNSEGIFAQGRPNPMVTSQKVAPETLPGVKMQNTPAEDIVAFPGPRLQVNDAADMNKFLESEQKILYPEQPFADPRGVIHIPISEAMKLVEQRLPVRPNAPAELAAQSDEGKAVGGPAGQGVEEQSGAQGASAPKQQKHPAPSQPKSAAGVQPK